MKPTVERVEAVANVELGEGPYWDEETQSLYFVDIFGKTIHRYVPADQRHTKAVIGPTEVTFIIPIEGERNKFLISVGRKLVVISWNGESDEVTQIRKICEVDNAPKTLDNRFNDGKCDPSGRLWAGTMGGEPQYGYVKPNKGSLFSYANGKMISHVCCLGISNGLAFNEDLKKMYYIDSSKNTVDEFDLDIETGTISNRKTVFSFSKNHIPGMPDGMAIDTDGNLWVAAFDGYRVIKIDPRKPETLLQTIDIPAKQTTSVVFGGANLDELYVTSAGFTVNGIVLPPPENGAIYRVTGLGVKGFPGVKVKL